MKGLANSDELDPAGYRIDEFLYGEPRDSICSVLLEGYRAPIQTDRATIYRLVRKPSNYRITWAEFVHMPIVQEIIKQEDYGTFQHVWNIQKSMLFSPVLKPFDLMDTLSFKVIHACSKPTQDERESILCHHIDCLRTHALQEALFLLNVISDRDDMSFLWKQECKIMQLWEWWYALFHRRFKQRPVCIWSSREAKNAFAIGSQVWKRQERQALIAFVCLKPRLGRDVARFVATIILKRFLVTVQTTKDELN